MIQLSREVRFSIPADPAALERPVLNSWAGWPPPRLGDPVLILRCTLAGTPDPASGYLCDIKTIDDAVREQVLAAAVGQTAILDSHESFLKFAWQQLKAWFLPDFQLVRLSLLASPWLSWSREASNDSMILLTQQFEFSASHRLHNPDLSAAENEALFGKCNNPHGHGHNYVVEVTVGAETGQQGQVAPEHLQSVVKTGVIDRLDHRNLNVEVEEFRELIPSVENISIVIWDWLADALLPARLSNVRVYETPKTWADFSGHQVDSA